MRARAMIVAVASALTWAASAQAAAASSTDKTGYITVNGLRMYVEEHGSGPPLVLLHGGGSTAQTSFGAIMPALARMHHVIAPEQQGHGHSADRNRPFSFEQMADDTAALLAHLGVAQADVVGFSNGGVVAMQLAMRHPRLVRRLIVCSSFYARAGMPAQFWQGFAHASMADMPPSLRAAFVAATPNQAEVPARFAKMVALMEGFRDIPEAFLRTISARSLVMVGDRDVMSVEHDAQLARILRGELAVMPGSGHGAYLGAAEAGSPETALVNIGLSTIEAFLAGELDGKSN